MCVADTTDARPLVTGIMERKKDMAALASYRFRFVGTGYRFRGPKGLRRLSSCLLILGCAFLPQAAWAGFQFLDPDIPDGERATYNLQCEGKAVEVRETTVVERVEEKERYEIRSYSEPLDRTMRIDKETMSILSVHTVRKFPDATLDSTLRVVDAKENEKDDEIKVADFSVLKYLLRGYPFGKREKLKISYHGEEGGRKYTMVVAYKKRETLKVDGQAIECHRLEFGLHSFLGKFLPKLKLWYSAGAPHYLVRYEGPEGPPGTPDCLMELLEYATSEETAQTSHP
jgi:hypothetical protein